MGRVGEALLFLLPSERGYLERLRAAGVGLEPADVLPALDLLPQARQAQQVWGGLRGDRMNVCTQLPGLMEVSLSLRGVCA